MPWLLLVIQIVLMNEHVDFALTCSYSDTTVTTDFGGRWELGFWYVLFFVGLLLLLFCCCFVVLLLLFSLALVLIFG